MIRLSTGPMIKILSTFSLHASGKRTTFKIWSMFFDYQGPLASKSPITSPELPSTSLKSSPSSKKSSPTATHMPPMGPSTSISKPTGKSLNTVSSKESSKPKLKTRKKIKRTKRGTRRTLPFGKPLNPSNPSGPHPGVKADPAGTLSALPWQSQSLDKKWTFTQAVST